MELEPRTENGPLLSVIVPAYNEETVLPLFYDRIAAVLRGIGIASELIFVNDGSSDRTAECVVDIMKRDASVELIDLSRNFGKESAMAAGLDHAAGDIVVLIDADLQDPPELIPALIDEWRKGYDCVYAKRTSRSGESALKKATAYSFYRVLRRLSNVDIPEDTGDFRLLSRRAVEALKTLRETQRFSKGLFAWIGYPQKAIPYERDSRSAGTTKWNYLRLWNLAVEGITSFSVVPLKFATLMGWICSAFAFAYMFFVLAKAVLFGDPVQGYPSLMVVILFLGGIQLLCLGILGEYLGRVFSETKRRPLYFVHRHLSGRSFMRDGESAAGRANGREAYKIEHEVK